MIRCIVAIALVCFALPSWSAVTAIGTPSSNASNSTQSATPSTAHTVASGTDVSYICIFGNSDATVSSINTFGGVAPQLVGDYANALHLYRVINPSAGPTTAQATLSASVDWSIHVIDLDGVDTADPDDAIVTNTNSELEDLTATVTSAAGDMVIACGLVVAFDIDASNGATLSSEEEMLNDWLASSAVVYEAGAASVTLGISTTESLGDNIILATNVNAAAGGGGNTGIILKRRKH